MTVQELLQQVFVFHRTTLERTQELPKSVWFLRN